MLPRVCSVKDRRKCENVVRKSVTLSAVLSEQIFS